MRVILLYNEYSARCNGITGARMCTVLCTVYSVFRMCVCELDWETIMTHMQKAFAPHERLESKRIAYKPCIVHVPYLLVCRSLAFVR